MVVRGSTTQGCNVVGWWPGLPRQVRPSPAPPPPPPPPSPAPPGAPNVLLMLVDDLRPWLPFYGAERLVAPNLAKLAASGVQFNNS